MKIGAMIESFRLGFKEAAHAAKAVGADGVQAYASGVIHADMTDAEIAEVRRILDGEGLVFSAVCGDFGCRMFYRPDECRDLIEKEKNPAKIKEYLDIVKERTLTLKTLTDELFKYSVSLDKSHGVYLQDVCLNTLIRECLLDQYEQFNQKNITPVIDLPQKNINCVADKKDLARVFQNIIGNALTYGDGDFGVKLYEDGVIDFYNTASGLTQVDVERMFDRFYTVKNNKFSTGLGLSIARSLTEQYGGSVQANLKDNILHIRLKFTVNS